ncbi:mitotic checkpoint serine/threonine-protein kinase BUB1 isoform X3 [Betta splendens]|uniref:Mitotic checkpoint serine/threonine-protein kinase BUB1 isoform X3 n=1 Tax=Betta splendens TaxID=158456 RepID=A0A9W2XLD5_BETSP|nr:mitotic checkpoint serine/threonine-protein kinase BUB1 isoform X3 [Betta splendens]
MEKMISKCFENAMTSYSGEDPLEQWDKFVDFAEKRLTDGSDMAVVLDRLVERFLDVPRYANDIRYVKHCIRCASYYSNPVALYSHIFRSGVGTKTAALYVAWAQQFEQRGMNEQADAVYQKAVENQALPADAVLNEYRLFQIRTKSQTPISAGVRTPLQSSQLTNQMPPHSEPVAQIKASVDCVPKQPQYCVTVSRSETSGMIPSSKDSGIQMVSKYDKEELVCEGSELCFEEVRAQRYFHKRQEQQEMDYRRNKERELREEEEAVLRIKSLLENYNQNLGAFGFLIHQPSSQGHLPVVGPATRQNLNPAQQNHLHSRFSSGLQPHTEPPVQQQHQTRAADTPPLPLHRSHHPSVPSHTDLLPREAPCQPGSMGTNVTQKDVSQLQELEDRLEVSLGGTANLSHITPNNSLGFVQATPSRALPSPTVNTREALDVIMDMFQAPTLLIDPLSNTSVLQSAEAGHQAQGDASTFSKPPTTTPFTIFQDDDKENPRAAAPPSACEKFKAARALAVIPVSKPNDTPPELTPDETMWGARYNSLHSLAACPNSSTDFAMLAQFVSTPYKQINAFGSNICQDQENNCDGGDVKEDAFRCRGNKLSPIMEQSPPDEKLSETAVSQIVPSSARLGTIVGEGLSLAQHCLTSSSVTMVQPPPPALLSFRDQTLCPNESSVSRTTGPAWDIYTSPEQPSKRTFVNPQEPEGLFKPGYEPFKVLDDLGEPGSPQKDQKTALDVPMSPECIVNPDWLTCKSPPVTVETDLDAFLSPRQPRVMDVPMSPEQPQLYADVSMSKEQFNTVDEPMMSPDRGVRPSVDVSMNATQPKTEKLQLVPDPWDDELISGLLSSLSPPLTSHPRCLTWQRNLPHISPKMTLSMGNASLRVDGVLGEGAFATVFQATDPVTSEKVVLKVQKPANPWEFYINTQLDARLQPGIRHLYSSVRSAHIFNNGSVLLEELHNYGTLLNAVNMYKTLGDKVMPQPLVMYFTICILHMVEQLHSINIIHADIKPDNFLLGERFMDNKDVDPDSVNHGLVLIDLGQSIDMKLFSENTAFTARCLTSGFQCTEMLSGKPWTYQTDYFGVAGTVHCLLFGTYMRVRNEGGVWKTDAAFRRNPHSDLWLNFFHTLLNVPDSGPLPSLRSLRCSLTSVLQQSYSSKLSSLRSRLVVLLLENHKPVRK